MKVRYAQSLFNDWDGDSDEIITDSISFEINGYVYQVGCLDEDDRIDETMWFSRIKKENVDVVDTFEVPEKWVPEQGSKGFEEYDKLNNFKLFRN
jgi:hypothetical protein